jgi:hypothetical protein
MSIKQRGPFTNGGSLERGYASRALCNTSVPAVIAGSRVPWMVGARGGNDRATRGVESSIADRSHGSVG